MTTLPYGADTIVIPFTIIPSADSRPVPPARKPSTTPSDPEQDADALNDPSSS